MEGGALKSGFATGFSSGYKKAFAEGVSAEPAPHCAMPMRSVATRQRFSSLVRIAGEFLCETARRLVQ
jgi:hypothetical protein